MSCTLFSIAEADAVGAASDLTLPSYDDVSSRISQLGTPHTLELGDSWPGVHLALGDHSDDHPLGFLVGGGAAVAAFADGPRSSGRYFTPADVVKILALVAAILGPGDEVERLRVFLAETVIARHGMIVHHFM